MDGKTEATGTDTTDWIFADNRPVFGVNDFTEAGNFVGGGFSSIFIYRRALSDDDVALHNAFPYAMFDSGELPLLALKAPPPYLTSQVGIVKPPLGFPLNRDHPLARGMVGCWLFNEGTGLNVWDATGRGKNGTLVGMENPATATSGWNAGLHGGALAFDGSDDTITAISPGLYSNYSICAQFRIASQATAFQGLVAWGAEATSQRRSLSLWNGGAGDLKLVSSTYASNISGATSLVIGVDYFGVIAVDSEGVANVYLNGALDGTGTNTLAAMGADAFSIGNIGLGSFFAGQMSSAFIFDRALSADEVAELYAFPYAMFDTPALPIWAPAPPPYLTSQVGIIKPPLGIMLNRGHPLARGLVGSWLFNEGAGPTVYDHSGREQNGTLTGIADPPTSTSGWGAGATGGALVLDGVNDYLSIASRQELNSIVNAGESVTFAIWVRLKTVGDYCLLGKAHSVDNQALYWIVLTGGVGLVGLIITNSLPGGSDTYTCTSEPLAANQLSLVTWTHTFGVGTSTRVYVNGQLATGAWGIDGNRSFNSENTNPLMLGRFEHSPYPRWLDGCIEKFDIYNRALSAGEVAELYADPFAMFEQPGPPYFPAAMELSGYNTSQGMFSLLH